MKTSLFAGSVVGAMVLSATSLALADTTISNPYDQEFKVSYEAASGEDRTVTLPRPGTNVGYANVKTPPKGPLTVTVSDDDGNVIAKAPVKDDQNYLLQKTAKGYALVWAGTLSRSETVAGVVVMNTLPETVTVDLFGNSGNTGKKNVKVNRSLDVKGIEKLSKDEDRFKVVIHLADGSTVNGENPVGLGRYTVIIHTRDGVPTLSDLGYIVPPKPKKK
jgi:hypothetical protein